MADHRSARVPLAIATLDNLEPGSHPDHPARVIGPDEGSSAQWRSPSGCAPARAVSASIRSGLGSAAAGLGCRLRTSETCGRDSAGLMAHRWARDRPGGPGIRRGVVAVRCPACAAEQRLEGQQDHACHCHPDPSPGQDVQGIVHPQVHAGPARHDGVRDPRRGEQAGQERHERDGYRQGDGGVAGGKAGAVRRVLAQHRVGHHLVGPGAVGDGLGRVRQHPGGAGGYGCGGHRQDASVSGHDVDDGEQDDGDDACWQEQMRQRRQR